MTSISYTRYLLCTMYRRIKFSLPPSYLLQTVCSPSPSLIDCDWACNTDDDRVVPLHSFKHAATLQHLLPHNPNPLLIRIDKKAGHGAGKSTDQRYALSTRVWRWLTDTNDMTGSRSKPTNGGSLSKLLAWSRSFDCVSWIQLLLLVILGFKD